MIAEEDIKSRLSTLKDKLKDCYPIVSMELFGSYVRNEQTETSDLDVMIEFNGKVGSKFIDIALETEQFLGVKVDLVSRIRYQRKVFQGY